MNTYESDCEYKVRKQEAVKGESNIQKYTDAICLRDEAPIHKGKRSGELKTHGWSKFKRDESYSVTKGNAACQKEARWPKRLEVIQEAEDDARAC